MRTHSVSPTTLRSRLIFVLTAVALVAAACGGDDSGDGSGGDGTTTTAAAAATTAPPAGTDAPTTTAPPATTEAPTTTTPVELTDSFRGVTAESIELGIAMVDFTQLNELGFIDFTHGDTELIWNALVDEVNADGGVLGRRLDVHFETYLPIGDAEAEAACVRLTEEQGVFAVLGLWIGASVLCLTELHDTIHIGHQVQQAWIDASNVPLVTPDITSERVVVALLDVLVETGRLEGATVGVFTDTISEEAARSVVVPALEDAGVALGSVGVLTDSTGDTTAVEAETDVFIERWSSEGVDTVLVIGNNGLPMVPRITDALDVQIVTDRPEVLRQQAPATGRPDAYAGALAVNGLNTSDREQFDEPGMQACIATLEAAAPEVTVRPPGERGDAVEDWYTGVRNACSTLSVFVQVATAAGPDLTNDSFTAALESFGDIELPGKVHASYGPGKYDADDGFRLYEFDPSVGDGGGFVPLTDIVDITP